MQIRHSLLNCLKRGKRSGRRSGYSRPIQEPRVHEHGSFARLCALSDVLNVLSEGSGMSARVSACGNVLKEGKRERRAGRCPPETSHLRANENSPPAVGVEGFTAWHVCM